jgi:hypothetical protein
MSSMYGQRGPTGMSSGDRIPKGYQAGQLQQFTPEQMQLFQSLFSHLGPDSYLSRLAGGDEALFGEIEAPALRQFSGIQGNIASRFSGMGAGARRSSGFQNTMNQASSDFAQDLQSKRQGLQQEALKNLFGLSSELFSQKPYERFLTEKPPSFLQQLWGAFGQAGSTAKDYAKVAAMFM